LCIFAAFRLAAAACACSRFCRMNSFPYMSSAAYWLCARQRSRIPSTVAVAPRATPSLWSYSSLLHAGQRLPSSLTNVHCPLSRTHTARRDGVAEQGLGIEHQVVGFAGDPETEVETLLGDRRRFG
jgi:hypothetical protein